MSHRVTSLIALTLVGRTAGAEVTRCASADADVRYHDALFSQLSGDTGWFPSGSPAQLELTARVAGETNVAMGLRPTACWNGPMMISVSGQPQAGQLDFAYGAELHLFAQIHTSILGNAIDWQGEIPLPTDFLLANTATFDPAMLPGSVVDHVAASDTTSPLKLLSTDLIGTYIGIPGISGGLHLDAVGSLATSYRSTAIVVGTSAIATADAAVASPNTTFGPALELPIAAAGTLQYSPALIFNVAFDVKILGIRVVNFTLFSLTVPLPQLDEPITLAGAGAHIPLPLAPPLDGARIDFAASTSQSLAIHNAGEGPLMIEATTLPAGVTAPAITIAPGTDGSLALTVEAGALADGQATLTLATNDPNQPAAAITLGRDIGGTSLPGKDSEPGGCSTGGGGARGLAALLIAAALLARRRRGPAPRDELTVVNHPRRQREGASVGPTLVDPPTHADATEIVETLLPADTGRFELGRVIGAGGMGEVRIARDTRIGREVAIKAIHGEGHGPQMVARFMREARIQARLDHPAIVPVYDLGVSETGAPYFAMKRLTGVTLDAVIARQRVVGLDRAGWTREELLARLIDVCFALEFAHRHGVVHRDIKPANIMLGEYGEVYVLDWGIARVLDEDIVETATPTGGGDPLCTVAGTVVGTLGYMSPEQHRGEAADARADIYALGCLLFEILTLRPALTRNPDAGAPTTPLSPRSRYPELEIPPELDELCAHATAPVREDRIVSARALATGLQRYLDGDRDVRRRRDMAGELARVARGALAIPDPHARKLAMREAGRALALDPANRDAQELVATLLFAPVHEVPAEVEQAIERDSVLASKAQIQLGAIVYAVYVMVLGVLWLAAGRSPWLLALGAAVVGNMIMFLVVARRDRPIGALLYPGLVVHCATIALAGIVFSPVLVIPALAVGAIAGFLTQPSSFRPVPVIVAHVVCGLLPIVLELTGVVPRTLWFAADGLRIHLWAVELSPVGMVTVLATVAIGQLLSTAALVIQLRRAKAAAERALHVQLWQLRQLVPS